MIYRGLFTVGAILMMASLTNAHGGATHVMGTVVSLDESRIEIFTTTNETVSVGLAESTRFLDSDGTPTRQRPRKGQRVAVEADRSNDTLVASEVRFAVEGAQQESEHDRLDHERDGQQDSVHRH